MSLVVRNINKRYGDIQALNDVSFTIDTGGVVALLGENGAGKSTLLRLISGFQEPNSGEILLNDMTIRKNKLKYLQMIGYVPEISALYGEMTVYDFLDLSARIRGLNNQQRQLRLSKLVHQLGIHNALGQKNETLSKGFKKRVALVAALLSEPQLLLLDEPTEGLDPNQKQILRQIINEYAKQHMVIFSTHTLEDVEILASKILLLHKGKLLADSDLAQFKQTAGDNLLQSFRQVTEK